MLKVYGVPLSQPFRSVVWALLQQNVKFSIQLIVPGGTNEIGSKNELFLSKCMGRTGTVPLLEDDTADANNNIVSVSESAAILSYLCEKYGWCENNNSLYGTPASRRKAVIDSYMHWHHTNTRQLSKLIMPYLRPDLKVRNKDSTTTKNAIADKVLRSFEEGWLKERPYIVGSDLSIADLLAYEEFAQLYMTGLLPQLKEYERVNVWCQRMARLPFHDEVHKSLMVLGNLADEKEIIETPVMKRLAKATKAGIAAMNSAQESFAGPSSKL